MTGGSAERRITEKFFYYFAFGSNLLQERLRVKGAEFESVGRLAGYHLTFFDHGKRWQGAVASIEEQPGAEVWGCVWRAPDEYAEDLDEQEKGYHRLQGCLIRGCDEGLAVPIEIGTRTIMCRTYQYSNPQREESKPSPHYKHVIVTGAKEHKLPDPYIKKLEAIQDNGYKGLVELDLEALIELNGRAITVQA